MGAAAAVAAPDTHARVRTLVRDHLFGGRPCPLSDTDSFLEAGVLDSLRMLELVDLLEGVLGVRVEDADLLPENLDSVAGLAAFVRRKEALP